MDQAGNNLKRIKRRRRIEEAEDEKYWRSLVDATKDPNGL